MKIKLKQLKQIISETKLELAGKAVSVKRIRQLVREELSRYRLAEVNREKLTAMYKSVAAQINKINPQTPPDEIEDMKRQIQSIGSLSIAAGERLFAALQKKQQSANTAWGHVKGRSTAAEMPRVGRGAA